MTTKAHHYYSGVVSTTALAALMAALLIGLLIIITATKPAHAKATTFTVNSTGDENDLDFPDDGSSDGKCDWDASTAGDQCTLRAAILEANARTGADTIKFNIPASTDTGCNATSGVCTIKPSPEELPDIIDPVIIDGYSQSGVSPNTLAVGDNAVLKIELSGAGQGSGDGLRILAAKSTVKGLVINNWENGVFLGVGATANKVMGNFIGTDASGTQGLGNNIGVGGPNAPNNTIGGTKVAARNIISDNGSGVNIAGGTGNKVQGNYIGTKANGTEALGNFQGVVIQSASNNTIGGTKAAARNIISGNSFVGISISFTESTGNKVMGNYIGTDASGTPVFDQNGNSLLGNGNDGVSIQAAAANNTIGGTKAAARNIISGNGNNGVDVIFDNSDFPNGATGNRILSNSIYDNAKLGIDLYYTNDLPGVTSNDDGDNDNGPNTLQNFPVLIKAAQSGKTTTIEGTLNSTANTEFIIQFFSSPAADDSDHGEGKTFLGKKSVTTDEDGNASFSFAASSNKIPSGGVVSATATNDATGDTSEFSKACLVPAEQCP